jgi:hypothetical protein
MNKDVYQIFEAYKNKTLNEAPVVMEPEYSGTGTEVKAEFPELSQGKYALSEQETAAVFSKFIQNFKAAGGKSPKLYKDFYETELVPVVREINPAINNTNAKYTSRVLYNALKAAKVVKDERDGVEGVSKNKGMPTPAGVQKLSNIVANDPERFEGEDPTEGSPEEPKDKTTVRIEYMVANKVDDTGVLESEVVNDVQREIMSSGGLGLEERSILSKVKAIISNLVRKNILERKGQYLKLGDNFEKFEAGGGQGSEVISDEDLIQKVTGLGSRPMTSRDVWSSGGDSSMFG